MNPRTHEEWAAYVVTLTGDDLWSKAMAANSLEFVKSLQGDDYAPAEITGVLRLFAKRLELDGQRVPSRVEGAYLDYSTLI